MAEEEAIENNKNTSTEEADNSKEQKTTTTAKENKIVDPEFFSCLLQPASADSDPEYIGIRRLLLCCKAESGVHRRLVTSLLAYICCVHALCTVFVSITVN